MPNSDSDNCSSELLAASDPNFNCSSSFCKTFTKKIYELLYRNDKPPHTTQMLQEGSMVFSMVRAQ